jgi:subtilase family serine protease
MTKSLCLVTLALTACLAPVDDEDLDTAEEASINCPPGDPDCTPYPTPTSTKKPDLVPVNLTAPDGRCWWDGYNLRFGVKNAGTATAAATTVWLGFSASWGRWYAVPSLAPGATYNLAEPNLRLDPSCYDGHCTMRVIADYGGAVTESSETNNAATRKCDFHF